MPSYCFKCECGEKFEKILPMSGSQSPQECKCGKVACRDIQAEHAQGTLDSQMKKNYRWSRTMGVPANQVEEFRKRYPNSTYSDRGDLLIKGRHHKLKQAKERNFYEMA